MTASTTPAGEAMREAVALITRAEVRDCIGPTIPLRRRWVDNLMSGPVARLHSEIARLTAERDVARAERDLAIANAREPVGDDWDEVRRLEGECRNFIRERGEWKAVADREAARSHAEVARVRAEHAAEIARRQIVVDVMTMELSGNRRDFFVRITCGGRSQTPHVFREQFKAEYEVAHLQWVFGQRPDAPDLMAYDETSYPNAALASPEQNDA